ncbi:MAG: MarR family transcriptional regulator, partial [Treponemataceae bacterium]|nr:MarR family transcriptional regulator [Treponemataceae bacterium]
MQVEKNDPALLHLDNQLCFALYACSRGIIKAYKPILDPLDLTYTEYVVLMALWENDKVAIKDLGKKIFLDSGTLTPLLKKMVGKNLVIRERSKTDERSVVISLTPKGKLLEKKCRENPDKLICAAKLENLDGKTLMQNLHKIIEGFASES